MRDVFVMGEQVVAGGRLTRIDESRLYEAIPLALSRFGKHLESRPHGAAALAGLLTIDM